MRSCPKWMLRWTLRRFKRTINSTVSKPYPYFPGHSGARPRHFSDLLNQRDSVLSGLRHKVQELLHLNALLGEFLDNPVLEHVQITATDGEQLVLTADSPVWGHRVRYLTPAIIDFLHTRGALEQVHHARILVRPPTDGFSAPPPSQHQGAELSERSAHLLQQVADELDNPELAKSLRRLSRRGRRS